MGKVFDKNSVCFLVLLCLSFGVYYPTLSGGFIWDDLTLIVLNPVIQEMSWANLQTIFTNPYFYNPLTNTNPDLVVGFFRPVANLTYALMHQCFGLNAIVWHAVLIVIHAVNAFFFYTLIKHLSKNASLALINAVLFIIHPGNHQIISYCTGLVDAVSLFFGFCFLVVSVVGYERKKTKVFMLFFSHLLFLLSVFTKEITFLLPLLAFFILVINTDVKITKGLVFRSLSYFWVVLFYFFWRKFGVGLSWARDFDITWLNVEYFLTVFNLFMINVGSFFLPLKPRLFEHFYAIGWMPSILDYGLFAIILVSWVFMARRVASGKIIVTGGVWFLLTYLPLSNLIPLHPDAAHYQLYFSDHLLYIPGLGLILILAAVFHSVMGRMSLKQGGRKFILIVTMISLPLLWGFKSHSNARLWGNPAELYLKVIETHPENYNAYINFGIYLNMGGNPNDALMILNVLQEQIEQMEEIDQKLLSQCLTNMGYVFLQLGKPDKAEEVYQKSIDLNRGNYLGHYGLGMARMMNRKYATARDAFKEAYKINAQYFPAKDQIEVLNRILTLETERVNP